ncbi:MAG TPA: Holliday junction branch migration DNA helicase RuvB, partial [Candidatus Saccharimonadales bacterium]|nr:Holliday junction branch migration DNA helicase RuvB [Candidatus Saccharimonadales bacterium]
MDAPTSQRTAPDPPPHHERVTDPGLAEGEAQLENSLRPRRMEDFLGQPQVKESLRIFLQAAGRRGEALEHVLLHGPPGLGKTTLANILAAEMGVAITHTSGPAIERPGDLAGLLTNLEPRSVLFVDEIHRLHSVVEEYLYPAMEDFRLDIMIDRGPSARSLRLNLERFTLVGATTRTGLISSPLRARFGLTVRLDYYRPEELAEIVRRSARLLQFEVHEPAVEQIARRARGTPRVANRLLRRVRDYAQIRGRGVATLEVTEEALRLLEVDRLGLDDMDRRMLDALISKYDGGPVGLNTLAAVLGEEPDTLEDVYEPYLVQEGFLKRTARGREATARAYEHLGRAPGT